VSLEPKKISEVVDISPANARDVSDVGLTPGLGNPWRRTWKPTPVFKSGESHGQGSLVGYSL